MTPTRYETRALANLTHRCPSHCPMLAMRALPRPCLYPVKVWDLLTAIDVTWPAKGNERLLTLDDLEGERWRDDG